MARRKTELRRLWLAGAATLLTGFGLAAPASAQTNCNPDGDMRATPYCFNAPGSVAPAPLTTDPINAENFTATTEAGERLACPDGGSYGKTLWMAIHPHVPGYFLAAAVGIDSRLALEDVANGDFICSDDSFDDAGTQYEREGIAVRGLEAGKTYLLQLGGRTRQSGAPDTGFFVLSGGFVADRDGDDVGDADDPCPDVRATGGCPSGGGGGTSQPPLSPGLSASDPDPDMDGIRGPADRCPGKGTRGRDVNQDGREDRRRQEIDVKWRIVPTRGRGVVMRELRLSETRKGTKVTIRCSRGCRKLTLRPTKGRLSVSAKRLRAGRLRPGTTIEVSVSRPGYNGETHRFKVLKTTMNQSWTRCLPEGKSTPVKGACY